MNLLRSICCLFGNGARRKLIRPETPRGLNNLCQPTSAKRKRIWRRSAKNR